MPNQTFVQPVSIDITGLAPDFLDVKGKPISIHDSYFGIYEGAGVREGIVQVAWYLKVSVGDSNQVESVPLTYRAGDVSHIQPSLDGSTPLFDPEDYATLASNISSYRGSFLVIRPNNEKLALISEGALSLAKLLPHPRTKYGYLVKALSNLGVSLPNGNAGALIGYRFVMDAIDMPGSEEMTDNGRPISVPVPSKVLATPQQNPAPNTAPSMAVPTAVPSSVPSTVPSPAFPSTPAPNMTTPVPQIGVTANTPPTGFDFLLNLLSQLTFPAVKTEVMSRLVSSPSADDETKALCLTFLTSTDADSSLVKAGYSFQGNHIIRS